MAHETPTSPHRPSWLSWLLAFIIALPIALGIAILALALVLPYLYQHYGIVPPADLPLVGSAAQRWSMGSADATSTEPVALAGVQVDMHTDPTSAHVYFGLVSQSGAAVLLPETATVEVLQDDVPVEAMQLTPVADSADPLTVAVLVNESAAMGDDGLGRAPLNATRIALAELVPQLEPSTSLCLYGVAASPRLLQACTTDTETLLRAIATLSTQPEAGTALYDGMVVAAYRQRTRAGHHALVVVSNSPDSASTTPAEEALLRLHQIGIPIYGIALTGTGYTGDTLHEAAQQTGGLYLETRTESNLPWYLSRVRSHLHSRYRVTMRPPFPERRQSTLTVRITLTDRTLEAQQQVFQP